MPRYIVALTALALTGAVLVMPDPSFAGGGGFRGSVHGGVRAPVMFPRLRHINTPRPVFRPLSRPLTVPHPVQFRPAAVPLPARDFARTTVRAPFVRLSRRHHGAYVLGSTYPITGNDESAYIGMPYDPGAAIPVYGPAPAADQAEPPPWMPPAPRISATRDENQDACRAERVTVPAAEGEREITVVRC